MTHTMPPRDPSFNEAAALRPQKGAHAELARRRELHASMRLRH